MLKELNLRYTYMLRKQSPHLLGLVSIKDFKEECIFFGSLLTLNEVVADKHKDSNTDENKHHHKTAIVHRNCTYT